MERFYPLLFLVIVGVAVGGLAVFKGEPVVQAAADPVPSVSSAPLSAGSAGVPSEDAAVLGPAAATAHPVCIRRGGMLDCPKG